MSTRLAFLLGLVVLLPVFDQSAFASKRGAYPNEIRDRLRWQLSRPRVELFDDARLGLWAVFAFGVRCGSLTTLTHGGLPGGDWVARGGSRRYTTHATDAKLTSLVERILAPGLALVVARYRPSMCNR